MLLDSAFECIQYILYGVLQYRYIYIYFPTTLRGLRMSQTKFKRSSHALCTRFITRMNHLNLSSFQQVLTADFRQHVLANEVRRSTIAVANLPYQHRQRQISKKWERRLRNAIGLQWVHPVWLRVPLLTPHALLLLLSGGCQTFFLHRKLQRFSI